MLHADRKRWDMQFALGGETALRACEAGNFDVVITDMRMPGMDGVTLLSHFQDRYPSTARIILSGYSEAALATRAVPMAHRFLTKPCSASELRSTIERVCALQDLLSSPELRSIVGMIGELPSLSRTYISLEQAVKDQSTSIRKVADIIGQDVAMSAKVLQLVNSAFFGLAQKVANVQNAASFLGMATIKNLALASEAFSAFLPGSRIPLAVYESMQRHAQRTAAIAASLPVDPKIRDVTVVSALLHDIGKLILATKCPISFVPWSRAPANADASTSRLKKKNLGPHMLRSVRACWGCGASPTLQLRRSHITTVQLGYRTPGLTTPWPYM